MKRARRLATLGLALALAPSALFAQFDPNDYYMSAPAGGGIWVGDAETGDTAPFALGMLVPHYGWFGNDGNFYVPDRGWPALMQVTPSGQVNVFYAGGDLIKPVTVIPNFDDTAMLLSDMEANKIFEVQYDGTVTVLHDLASTNGLLNWPDGLAYDDDGNLYAANLGDDKIIKIDPQGNASLFSDSPLIWEPGGIAIDGAGNMFVANYASHLITRIRLDTGEAEDFTTFNSQLLANPNDLKLSRNGGMVVSGRHGRVSRVDALGNVTILIENEDMGELDGVSVQADETLCTGRYSSYGTGQAGSGGFTPEFRAIFSPCSGQTIGLEFRDFVGGAPVLLFVGSSPLDNGVATFKGAPLLVDPSSSFFWIMPLFIPGVGAGGGDLTLQFQVPEMPGLAGLELYHQVFAGDAGAPNGVSASNGLKETFGN